MSKNKTIKSKLIKVWAKLKSQQGTLHALLGQTEGVVPYGNPSLQRLDLLNKEALKLLDEIIDSPNH